MNCAWLLADPEPRKRKPTLRLVVEAGRIAAIAHAPELSPGPRRLVLPALTNAHDHGRYFRSATVDAFEKPLESWLPFMDSSPVLIFTSGSDGLSHVQCATASQT